MSYLFKNFWKTSIWLLIICYLTLTPSQNLPKMPHLFEYDKIGHIMLFLIFTLLLIKSISLSTTELTLQKIKFIVFISSTFISGLIEILQANFIQNRSGDVRDLIADIFGTLIGLLIYNNVAKKFYRLI